MRSHLGMIRLSSHPFKSKAAVHQLSPHVTELEGVAIAQIDHANRTMSGIQTQLTPQKITGFKKGQADCKEAVEFSQLKAEVKELRAQVQAIESAEPKKTIVR